MPFLGWEYIHLKLSVLSEKLALSVLDYFFDVSTISDKNLSKIFVTCS